MEDIEKYFNRDLSWLSFNKRVLLEAADPVVPLYDRIKFLAIYSSNLDEFFRVRVAFLKRLVNIKSLQENSRSENISIFESILNEIQHQQVLYFSTWKEVIQPALRENNIHIYQEDKVLDIHIPVIHHYFRSKVLAYLQPVFLLRKGRGRGVFFENGHLYFVIQLKHSKLSKTRIAILNIPSESLSRTIQLPGLNNVNFYIFLDDIIKMNLSIIFPNYAILSCHEIKVNRDAELYIDDEYSGDLIKKIKAQLKKRRCGTTTRFLYDEKMPVEVLQRIQAFFHFKEEELIPGAVYHNMKDLLTISFPDNTFLSSKTPAPLMMEELETAPSVFEVINQKDILLHYPYHSYDYVLQFFNEAAIDPEVQEINITVYRIAVNSLVANALITAARNGKKVRVFVEVKARFDEENNLKWAAKMQESGITIIYSLPGLKVHAKAALIKRKNPDHTGSEYFSYVSTGNFNETTARVYTDHGLFTKNKKIGKELNELFVFLNKGKMPHKMKHILVSQFNMQQRFLDLIDQEIVNARENRPSGIMIRMNSLEDKKMIDKLYEASQAGVLVHCLSEVFVV